MGSDDAEIYGIVRGARALASPDRCFSILVSYVSCNTKTGFCNTLFSIIFTENLSSWLRTIKK